MKTEKSTNVETLVAASHISLYRKICLALVLLVLCVLYIGLYIWMLHLQMDYIDTWYITLSGLITATGISLIWQKSARGRISARCTVYTVILAFLMLFLGPSMKTHIRHPSEPGVYHNTWGYFLIPFGDTEVIQLPPGEYDPSIESGTRDRDLADFRTYRRFAEMALISLVGSCIPTFLYLLLTRNWKTTNDNTSN